MKHPSITALFAVASVTATGWSSGQNLEPATGTQIGWATQAFATNLMADGFTTFEEAAEAIRFELGTFSPGFDPSTATPEQWVSNWIVLQGADYDLLDQQVIQTATLASNNSPFAQGGQAYIWGYTSKDVDPTSQWILVGSPLWKWPSSSSPLPTTFSMSDALPGDALFGNVNVAGGQYHMQLQQAVPEPSASLMAGLAGLGMIWRRRR